MCAVGTIAVGATICPPIGSAQSLTPITLYGDLKSRCNVNGPCALGLWANSATGDVSLVKGDGYYLTDMDIRLIQPLTLTTAGQPAGMPLVNANIEVDLLIGGQVMEPLLVRLDESGIGRASAHLITGIQINGAAKTIPLQVALTNLRAVIPGATGSGVTPAPTQTWSLGRSTIVVHGQANSTFLQHWVPGQN